MAVPTLLVSNHEKEGGQKDHVYEYSRDGDYEICKRMH